MDELSMLRRLAVDTALDDAAARSEVWERLAHRRRPALDIRPRVAVAAAVT